MPSFFLRLTPEQQAAALAYDGPESHSRSDLPRIPLTERMKHLIDTAEERHAGYMRRWLDRCPDLRDFLRAKPR